MRLSSPAIQYLLHSEESQAACCPAQGKFCSVPGGAAAVARQPAMFSQSGTVLVLSSVSTVTVV